MKKYAVWIIVVLVLAIVAGLLIAFWPDSKKTEECTMVATILELGESHVLVEPAKEDPARASSDKISFGTANLEDIGAQVGSTVKITYSGEIMESYPAQIIAIRWELVA